jgi:tetratricopeptide (TPR) repeat protein
MRKSFLSGSYEDLAAQAQQALQINNYPKAREIYERLYQRLGKMKPETLDHRPNLKELLLISVRTLGDLANFRGDYAQSLEYYERALELDPDQAQIYQRAIAQTQIDKGEVETGLDALRALAFAGASELEPWLWLGIELTDQGQYEEAEESLLRATRLTTAEPQRQSDAYAYLHDLYREQGRLDEAAAAWHKVWEVAGLQMEDVSPLYQMYWEVEDLEKAWEWLQQEKNPLRAGFYRGLFLQAEGERKKAEQAWRKTADLDPLQQGEGHESWAEAALRANTDPRRVASVLREVTGRDQMNLRGAILQTIAEIRAGRPGPAQAALHSALKLIQRARPREDLLSYAHWLLFDELVPDISAKMLFQRYFITEKQPPAAEQLESAPASTAETESAPEPEAETENTVETESVTETE